MVKKRNKEQTKHLDSRILLLVFFASILISFGIAYVTFQGFNKLNKIFPPITGFATSPNGTATVTINTFSSIKFVDASVNFGSGNVNLSGGYTNCTLDTYGTARGCESFTTIGTPTLSSGFTVENDGNTNLTVELVSNATASQFIGASSAVFQWNVSINETGSCKNTTTSTGPENNVNPNTTTTCGGPIESGGACGAMFESVYTTGATGKTICPRLLYADTSDSLRIDINITIPQTASAGAKGAKFTATGTRHPTS